MAEPRLLNLSLDLHSREVMATASFPAVFNFVTLRNFEVSDNRERYVHVFDGGNSDNLGLKSAMRIIDLNKDKYGKIVVILMDAYTQSTDRNKNRF